MAASVFYLTLRHLGGRIVLRFPMMRWWRRCGKKAAPCRALQPRLRGPRHDDTGSLSETDAAHGIQSLPMDGRRVRRLRPDNWVHKSGSVFEVREHSGLPASGVPEGRGGDRRPPCFNGWPISCGTGSIRVPDQGREAAQAAGRPAVRTVSYLAGGGGRQRGGNDDDGDRLTAVRALLHPGVDRGQRTVGRELGRRLRAGQPRRDRAARDWTARDWTARDWTARDWTARDGPPGTAGGGRPWPGRHPFRLRLRQSQVMPSGSGAGPAGAGAITREQDQQRHRRPGPQRRGPAAGPQADVSPAPPRAACAWLRADWRTAVAATSMRS